MASLGGEPDDFAGIDDVVTPRNDEDDDSCDNVRTSMEQRCLAALADLSDRVPEVPHSAPGRLQLGVAPLRAAGLRESNACDGVADPLHQLLVQVPVRSENTLMAIGTGNGGLCSASGRCAFISALEKNLKMSWFPKRRKRPLWAFYQPAAGLDAGDLIGDGAEDTLVTVPDNEGPKTTKVKKEFVYVSRHGLEGLSWHVQNNHGVALRELEERMSSTDEHAGVSARENNTRSANGKGRRQKRKASMTGEQNTGEGTPALKLLSKIKQIVPTLSRDKYKGQAGKVGVVGGCQEYTGAPYFAAYSALMVGADLSHVFCEASAATVIKGYSPELIVHPYLKDSKAAIGPGEVSASDQDKRKAQAINEAVEQVGKWLSRLDCIVIGPGLGRDSVMLETAQRIIHLCREHDIPMIIDADGLWIVNQDPGIIKGYSKAVLTPNMNEFRRLRDALDIDDDESEDIVQKVTEHLSGPIVMMKGNVDIICKDHVVVSCDSAGSLRRCGGQGDVLAGTMAAFVSWASKLEESKTASFPKSVLAVAGASLTTRYAAAAAFTKHKRAMTATCLIEELGNVMESLFDPPKK